VLKSDVIGNKVQSDIFVILDDLLVKLALCWPLFNSKMTGNLPS
jgi:hypothetical protein